LNNLQLAGTKKSKNATSYNIFGQGIRDKPIDTLSSRKPISNVNTNVNNNVNSGYNKEQFQQPTQPSLPSQPTRSMQNQEQINQNEDKYNQEPSNLNSQPQKIENVNNNEMEHVMSEEEYINMMSDYMAAQHEQDPNMSPWYDHTREEYDNYIGFVKANNPSVYLYK